MTRSRGIKNDRVDAYTLAEKLRIGAADKPVFKAPSQFSRLRELARVHSMFVCDVVISHEMPLLHPTRDALRAKPGDSHVGLAGL